MSEWKIRRSTLEIVMLCLSLYEFTGVPHSLFLVVKYLIIAYLLLSHIKEWEKMKKVIASILLYGGITFTATLVYQNALNTQVASFVYMLHILTIYVTITAFVRYRGVETLIKLLIKTLLVFVLVTDISMLFINYNFSSPSESYLIGNKFTVSYLHCFIVALLFCINNEKNRKNLFFRIFRMAFLLFSIMICRQVTCTTGILICLFMGAMTFFPIPLSIRRLLSSPIVVILITVVTNFLVLGSFSLLTNPYVENFIFNVLGKSYTWVGRLHIYAIIFDVIKVHPWIGYGYFSNIVEQVLGFGNAQNGVLKIIVDSGIVGLIGYVLLVYCSMKKNEDLSKEKWTLTVFIYCMIIASIAEINLTDYLFFLTIAILFVVGENNSNFDARNHIEERKDTVEKITRKKRFFKRI